MITTVARYMGTLPCAENELFVTDPCCATDNLPFMQMRLTLDSPTNLKVYRVAQTFKPEWPAPIAILLIVEGTEVGTIQDYHVPVEGSVGVDSGQIMVAPTSLYQTWQKEPDYQTACNITLSNNCGFFKDGKAFVTGTAFGDGTNPVTARKDKDSDKITGYAVWLVWMGDKNIYLQPDKK